MNKEIWIYAEKQGNVLNPVTYELITKANEIKEDKKVVVVLFQTTNENLEESITKYGPDEIIVVKDDSLKNTSDSFIANLLKQLSLKRNPNTILFGSTVLGRSISARLQAQLLTGLTADCLDLSFENDLLIQTKPSYGDNIMCEIVCPNNYPQMASVRSNVFKAEEHTNENLKITYIDDLDFKLSKNIKIKDETPLISKRETVSKANKVIAIGRGSSDEEAITLVKELSNKLGAKIGVTRPLTDSKDFTHEDQIGQSGNTITPNLLLNLGIHGAVQYTSGIKNSKVIVSVNTNEKAPIFLESDYGYIGDSKEFLKELLKLIQ